MLAETKLEGSMNQLKQKIYQQLLEMHQKEHQRFLQRTRKQYIQRIRNKISGGQPQTEQQSQPHQVKPPANQQNNQGIDNKFKSKCQGEQSHVTATFIHKIPDEVDPDSSESKQGRQLKQIEQGQSVVLEGKCTAINEDEPIEKQDLAELSQNISSGEQRRSESDEDSMVMLGQDQISGGSLVKKTKKDKKKKPTVKIEYKMSTSLPQSTVTVLQKHEGSGGVPQTSQNLKKVKNDLEESKGKPIQKKQICSSDEDSMMMAGQDQINGNNTAEKTSKKKQRQEIKLQTNLTAVLSAPKELINKNQIEEKKTDPEVPKAKPRKSDSDEDLCMNDDDIM